MWKCENSQFQLPIGSRFGHWLLATLAIGNISTLATFAIAPAAMAEQPAYTNHAGNVVAGVVVALDARAATISNAEETVELPLSIFPEFERRRIAADFALRQGGGLPGTGLPSGGQIDQLRVPPAVKRAVVGAKKAMARSRKRAALGLCSQEECDAFCAESEESLRIYLDKQVLDGVITPAERTALAR